MVKEFSEKKGFGQAHQNTAYRLVHPGGNLQKSQSKGVKLSSAQFGRVQGHSLAQSLEETIRERMQEQAKEVALKR